MIESCDDGDDTDVSFEKRTLFPRIYGFSDDDIGDTGTVIMEDEEYDNNSTNSTPGVILLVIAGAGGAKMIQKYRANPKKITSSNEEDEEDKIEEGKSEEKINDKLSNVSETLSEIPI